MQKCKHPDPFFSSVYNGRELITVNAADRIEIIKNATLAECEYALAEYKGRLQRTVENAIARRIRVLKKRYPA